MARGEDHHVPSRDPALPEGGRDPESRDQSRKNGPGINERAYSASGGVAMSTGRPDGKKAGIWEQSFFGNRVVAGLSPSDKMCLMTIIIEMNAMDSADITTEVIENAATQLRVKPSRIRKALAKCDVIFDRRPDGMLYSSKTARRLQDRKYRDGGQESGRETGQKTGQNAVRNADTVSQRKPSNSALNDSVFRRTSAQDQKQTSEREERIEVQREKESSVSLPGVSNSDDSLSKKSLAPQPDGHHRSGDPLAALAARCQGLVATYQWKLVLANAGRHASEVLGAWSEFPPARDDSPLTPQSTIAYLLTEATRKKTDGRIVAANILKTILSAAATGNKARSGVS